MDLNAANFMFHWSGMCDFVINMCRSVKVIRHIWFTKAIDILCVPHPLTVAVVEILLQVCGRMFFKKSNGIYFLNNKKQMG